MKTTDEILKSCLEGRSLDKMPRQMSRAIDLARKDLYPLIFIGQQYVIWDALCSSIQLSTRAIAQDTGLKSKNVSSQLSQMTRTGLVKFDQIGKLKKWYRAF